MTDSKSHRDDLEVFGPEKRNHLTDTFALLWTEEVKIQICVQRSFIVICSFRC